jgi:hypothetical protein
LDYNDLLNKVFIYFDKPEVPIMRRDIVPAGADSLSYEIREIVVIAEKLEKLGLKLTYENIGDPIAKGEKIVPWIK